ncbi:diguanylate cyclase [candidate division KSB3 bacterium]|uniref:Diguanylate cyclase n=1 Tax=candidate division KSB3 bacterium TaxID=2044937 RepID=A0A2G6KAD7_9BACT|nr:MAG: diguanylate cyclase [candidate division KSB3 bacterium]
MKANTSKQSIENQAKGNLLLVDDKPENLLALESILEDELNCNLFKATSGHDALRLLLKHDFALALVDVQMPGMNGFELAELIRGRHRTRHLPIIFVTAISKEQKHIFKGYESGAVDYLFKPLDADILKSKTRVFLELHQQKKMLERQAETLRKSEEKYRTVLESAPDPVVVYDMEGKVSYLNAAFSRVFGWTLEESKNREIDFVPTDQLADSRELFLKIAQGEMLNGIETSRLTKDGRWVDVSISGAGFFDKQGGLQGSVITIQDITSRKKSEEEIRFIAYHDTLTGLPNRKAFYMQLEGELKESPHYVQHDRRGKGTRCALLFLDLNKFKNVNDTLGHDIGDELLKIVTDRLCSSVRKSDLVFRLSGDEFTILLNDLSNDRDIVKVVEKIQEVIAEPYHVKNHELYVTVSIGISMYPDDGEDVETLVKNADMAMYAAKEESEGYRFFTEAMNQKALERMRLESSLRTALQNRQFVVYYQPLVKGDSQIAGVEALLRWHHPEFGVVSPAKFIPLAEETGSIISIGKWVLFTACRQVKKWIDMGYSRFYVSVNLSARQFKEPDLVETIEHVLDDVGLPPECLKLEVTESGIMEDPEQAVVKMTLLRKRGIYFSIDDFGTGYSSLSYLKRFPIDILKIDRSFVMDAPTNEGDREIIKTIISMARNLNLNTVAEGVETQEQQDFLTSQGCHMMQGYYFGRPMLPEKIEAMLQDTTREKL